MKIKLLAASLVLASTSLLADQDVITDRIDVSATGHIPMTCGITDASLSTSIVPHGAGAPANPLSISVVSNANGNVTYDVAYSHTSLKLIDGSDAKEGEDVYFRSSEGKLQQVGNIFPTLGEGVHLANLWAETAQSFAAYRYTDNATMGATITVHCPLDTQG